MSLPGQVVDPFPPATLAEALSRSDIGLVVCLQVTCGIEMTSWHWIGGKAGDVGYMHPLGDFSGEFNDSVDEITAVYVNGVALAQGASVDDVCHSNGKFFWDGVASQALIISMPDGSNPQARGVTVEAIATYRFSDGPTDYNGYRWKPWILGQPSLTRSVTPDFSSITQLGTGSVTFQNETHWFDTRENQNWDAGRATLILGAAGLPWSEFKTQATFVPNAPILTDNNFKLSLQDPIVLVDTYYPSATYSTATYPNLDPAALGKPIQVAYGKILGVVPTCINIGAGVFKVAGHAITSFDGCRVQSQTTGLWQTVNFASVNTATAQFSLASIDFTFGQVVVVDFSGKPNAHGYLMDNPADIIQDLITNLGQPTNTAGFAAARARYDAGYQGTDMNHRVSVHTPSIYLDTQAKALSTIQEVMQNVRAYLQTANDGTLTMTPFRNYQISTLPQINDNNIFGPGITIDGNGTSSQYVQAGTKVSQAQVTYGVRQVEGISQLATWTNARNKNTRLMPTDVIEPMTSLFNNSSDALYLAQCLVNEYRVDPKVWSVTLKWLPMTWPAGQQVWAYFPRHCVSFVLEVLTVALDLTTRKCKLTLGNLRGFQNSSGFWVNSTDKTPAGNSLAWPGQGEANDMTGEIAYIRLEAGHWHDPTDFAVDTSSPASIYSDADKGVRSFRPAGRRGSGVPFCWHHLGAEPGHPKRQLRIGSCSGRSVGRQPVDADEPDRLRDQHRKRGRERAPRRPVVEHDEPWRVHGRRHDYDTDLLRDR